MNVTAYIIDDINNFLRQNEHLHKCIKILKEGRIFKVYHNETLIYMSLSPSELLHYLINNWVENK